MLFQCWTPSIQIFFKFIRCEVLALVASSITSAMPTIVMPGHELITMETDDDCSDPVSDLRFEKLGMLLQLPDGCILVGDDRQGLGPSAPTPTAVPAELYSRTVYMYSRSTQY